MKDLTCGTKVLVQEPGKSAWSPEIVKPTCHELRLYVVEMLNGSQISRNRRFLKEVSSVVSSRLCMSKQHGYPSCYLVVTFNDNTHVVNENNDRHAQELCQLRRSIRQHIKPARLIE